MITVYTKDELRNAIELQQFPIVCKGEIAEQLKKKKKRKKNAKIGGALLALGGLAAIPFTGGASAVATGAGLTAMGLTATGLAIGTVTISLAELIVLVGGSVAMVAVLKGRKVKLQSDGSVVIE